MPPTDMEADLRSRQRMQVILQVAAGKITATEAARQMGVSRKTYYEWENRAMSSLAEAVKDQPTGRPTQIVDEEKEALRRKVQDLEIRLRALEASQRIREVINGQDGAQKK